MDNLLFDHFGRAIDYLRISVTDRCNLKCMYCAPGRGVPCTPSSEILTYEEIVAVVRSAAEIGIRKIRITGGEPLVRKDIVHLIAALGTMPGIADLSLTTNGILLSAHAKDLQKAGMNRINISLDTIDPEKFRMITGSDGFFSVWEGIETVIGLGFRPVKINVVVMRGINDDELLAIARLTRALPLEIRFIEFMPVGNQDVWREGRFVAQRDILAAWEREETIETVPAPGRTTVSAMYRMKDAAGTVSFISPISRSFCRQCSRLRLTSQGKLRPCLGSDREIDLKSAVRGDGASSGRIKDAFIRAAAMKPEGHCFSSRHTAPGRQSVMCQIGG